MFDPSPSFLGTVSVPYSICDVSTHVACDTAYLSITVNPVSQSGINSVIANNDENVTIEVPVSGNVLQNDKDPQGHTFTVTAVTGSTPGVSFTVSGTDRDGNPVPADAGTLVINADGSYTYTPASNFDGDIDVPYTITDSQGATATAVLQIHALKDQNGFANGYAFCGR